MIESQAEFGIRIGVSRQCVGGYIKRRKLTGKALVQDGGTVLINVEEAQRQLRIRLDADQRICNGKAKLEEPKTAQPSQARQRVEAPGVQPDSRFLPTEAWAVLREVPNLVAWELVSAGTAMKFVFAVDRGLRQNLRDLVERTSGGTCPGEFDPPDWSSLAAEAEESLDLDAWNAWLRDEHLRRFGAA